MEKKYITNSSKQTQKIGEDFAKEILNCADNKQAIIIGLSGNLGGGKTNFLQGFARGLGIKEKILSPTFVIQKKFSLKKKSFKNFYHIDCYRLKKSKDILELDFKETIKDPENVVAIEWPEKVKIFLPKDKVFIRFEFLDKCKRKIVFQ